jgi:uncharacterized membrane protein YdjX (TVP38/TMEM64 family)
MSLVTRLVIFAAIIMLCIHLSSHMTPHKITAFVEDTGPLAPVSFIALCTIKPLLFFLPSLGLTVVAGIMFGACWGTAYVAIGGALSTLVGFYFARWMGRSLIERLVMKNRYLAETEEKARTSGKNVVLYLRLVNVPWDLVSYWAGLSGIRFKDFYIASLIPLIPVSFLYTYFGSTIFSPKSPGFIISLSIIFVMGAAPYVRQTWSKRKANG